MAKGSDYKIKKLEKGPLQRFKNQNLLIKKYGEIGLQIYRAITGKRTTAELKKDLGTESKMFDEIINYMQDAGMVELTPVSKKPEEEKPPKEPGEKKAPEKPEGLPEKKPAPPPPEAFPEEEREIPTLEELPEEEAEEVPPLEEEIEFEPIEPIGVEGFEEPEEKPEKEPEKPEEEPGEEPEFEPIEFEEVEGPEEEAPPPEKEKPEEKKPPSFKKPPPLEPVARKPPPPPPEGPELSPVEKIISDKYGDLGLKVYALIDGQRTAEEIMGETGLTEAKLVEILDFMDEQGIIKLDYPKGKGRAPPPPPPPPFAGGPTTRRRGRRPPPPRRPPPSAKKKARGGFAPMIESEESLEEARAVPSPLAAPVKAPLDIVKSVQLKAKMMFKLGDKGSKVIREVDGQSDVIDISLELDMPLYEVMDILKFMMQNGMVIMKALSRSDVHKKYGDDGYAVYKRYGKEGLMLYELIGRDLTIKQMADKITRDRSEIIDMFAFIHQVLGIELPVNKEMIAKQLEL
ncbi:hypothetical protein GF318_02925 [Candidatus Micrarchaeota archaeon]|nr:hypothetical protein [Candidatus Micrarchaeota archaeon]